MKNISKILAYLVTSVALFSTTVQAAPYISGQVGIFGYGDNNYFKNVFDNDDELGLTGRAALGYAWDINDCMSLGAEVGLNGFENADYTFDYFGNDISIKTKRWSTDILGVVNGYATPKINFFAKAGAAYVKQKHVGFVNGFQFASFEEKGKFVPKAGVGMGYDLQENLNLNLSLNHEFERDSSTAYIPAASSVMVGLTYSFS